MFEQTWEPFNREAWYWTIRMSHINGQCFHSSFFEGENYIKENKLSIAYIPTYSPEMAPIEKYFSVL